MAKASYAYLKPVSVSTLHVRQPHGGVAMVVTRYGGIVENVLATELATGSPNSKTNRASTGWTLYPGRPVAKGRLNFASQDSGPGKMYTMILRR